MFNPFYMCCKRLKCLHIKMKRRTAGMGATFLDYEPQSGRWSFKVLDLMSNTYVAIYTTVCRVPPPAAFI